MKKFPLSIRDRVKYMCLVLLNEIINFQTYFPTKLVGDNTYLGPYLDMMVANGVLTREAGQYVPTAVGREELETFYAKYYEYLKMFDIYCAVDLGSGEFAFSRINDETLTDEGWGAYLSEERFSDVRVAIAEFKGINPNEIVFMSYLNEGRFNVEAPNWQYDLTNENGVWDEIENITDTAIEMEYLLHDDVISDVIETGTKIAIELIRQAEELRAEEDMNRSYNTDEQEEEIITTEYVEIVEMPCYGYDYWDPYYDPYYVSPIWLLPVLLW